MFKSLKKLFGGTDKEARAATSPASKPGVTPGLTPDSPPLPTTLPTLSPTVAPMPDASAEKSHSPQPQPSSAFLCREAVFDRKNRLAGRLFRLQQSSAQADAEEAQQREFDQTLLATLNASTDAWNTSLAFIPLSSASLCLAAVDRLKTTNLVLLVQLAQDADAGQLVLRLETLRQRGLAIGIFRQPKNPAFTQVIAFADYGCIDVGGNEANTIRDFSAAFRAKKQESPTHLFGGNIDTLDEQRPPCSERCRDAGTGRSHEAGSLARLPHPALPELAGTRPQPPHRLAGPGAGHPRSTAPRPLAVGAAFFGA